MTIIQAFQSERPRLTGLAYRMLGSVADAEDVVQDAFLRWERAGRPELDSPRAWFTRTCVRLCLDRLKSVKRARETYVGAWLPEPFVGPEVPESRMELDESLSMALLLAVQRLAPAERAAFLLHDVFDTPFDEVAATLELTPANCRQLASRARKRLRGDSPERHSGADVATVSRLTNAFFTAIETGDDAALRGVLAADVVLTADGGGKAVAVREPLVGAYAVSRFFVRIAEIARERVAVTRRAVTFNGSPGQLVYEDGVLVSAFHFAVERDRIARVFVVRNPDKLRRLATLP